MDEDIMKAYRERLKSQDKIQSDIFNKDCVLNYKIKSTVAVNPSYLKISGRVSALVDNYFKV